MKLMAVMDPGIAEKMKDMEANKINVIETSGPGFMTREIFSYLQI